MGDEVIDERTFKQKLLFYITAFFVLLGTFSLFGFLFLVPFVIEPAFTTIFMEFDTNPASCVTVEVQHFRGASNCSWTSCREGCTKEVYECTQIRVNYKIFKPPPSNFTNETIYDDVFNVVELTPSPISTKPNRIANYLRAIRGIRDYDYVIDDEQIPEGKGRNTPGFEFMEYSDVSELTGLMGNTSEWFFTGARLFPNVKGCGYPPALNCTIWGKKYKEIGTNFSCYYSRIDPGLVISDLDMHQNTLNLIYAMAIPIPSFIASVIYLTFAYFKIYNEDEETAPLDENAEEIAGEDEVAGNDAVDIIVSNGNGPKTVVKSNPISPSSDINSFGHQLKVKMADEMSRDSLDGVFLSNSASLQG